MQKLELKHLSAYLPYQLKCIYKGDKNVNILGLSYNEGEKLLIKIGTHEWTNFFNIKPIIRPLSDLTKDIEVNGEKFIPIEWFEIGDDDNVAVDYGNGNVKLIGLLKDMSKYNFIDLAYINYGVVEKLLEWHFDIFGLIKQNLAIDINTL